MMWNGMWNGYGGWGFGGMHLLWWLLLVVLLVVWFRPGAARRRARGSEADRSIAILRERYARGEIDQNEYDERLRRLAQGAGPASVGGKEN